MSGAQLPREPLSLNREGEAMAICRKCGYCGSADEMQEGMCCVCAAEARGERPAFTLPRDEWEAMSKAGRKAARAEGISPEPMPPAVDKDDVSFWYER